jgi:hypothetical protein
MSITLIYSSNLNPVYTKFAVLQEEVCTHLGLATYFCKSGASECYISDKEAHLPSIEGVPDVFVAQVARYIMPAFFPERDFIVGDIDMLFLSRRYVSRLKKIIEHNRGLIQTDTDIYNNVLRAPCCYYVGKGSVFADILGLHHPTWEDVAALIRQIWLRGEGWTGDEYFFSEAAWLASDRIPIAQLNGRVPRLFGNRTRLKGRINRSNWRYSRLGLIMGGYIDVHCLRPIEHNIHQLRHLFNFAYCGLNGMRYLRYELSRVFLGAPDLFPSFLKQS